MHTDTLLLYLRIDTRAIICETSIDSMCFCLQAALGYTACTACGELCESRLFIVEGFVDNSAAFALIEISLNSTGVCRAQTRGPQCLYFIKGSRAGRGRRVCTRVPVRPSVLFAGGARPKGAGELGRKALLKHNS
ncbi:hypothetical protein EVAR_76378_1 [Eumeta japonica]|uniref:Uncharacterized protein n=1 Tax=Eumeta variegata TaxID=151549 RepID=A0A4C1T7R0_EUMVA|nr:hypothetical protein EVAR_76378_1 [Eumeta japonica]